jgi:hypothetical protein
MPSKKIIKPVTKKKPAPTKKLAIDIDFPQENESVFWGHYAIRITSLIPGSVQICINNGEWLTCRNSDGFWWYDWHPLGPGTHSIIARVLNTEGKEQKSKPRSCDVIPVV